ncbi:RNase A-like domain-containing protein [Streptomyces sp. NPDC048361]|uniref:RNase A-like domain-containing protein n=1 Tax=Streptomyces sp. NPDC048361 TaxID=3154720 RepID=UPI0034460836
MGTPPSGNIDVRPTTLHQVAAGFAREQTPFDKAAKNLITQLKEYPDAGGYGTAAQGFAASYLKVGNLYLEVWAKSVVSIGGAAVGFATTANNYSRAEAANDASGKTKAQIQAPPAVIDTAPDYGSVPDLKWGDDDGGDDFFRSLLESIPSVVWHIIRPLLEHAFRWGKVAEVYPYPQQHYLNSLSQSWADMTKALSWTEGSLTGQMYSITQQSDSEWHDAMRQFCSSLWGTTAWGKTTANYEWQHDKVANHQPSHPVMSVLFDSAMKISDLLRAFAEAAVYVNGEVWDVYFAAIKKAVGDIDLSHIDLKDVKEGIKGFGRLIKGVAKGAAELSVEITLDIDTAAINRIVAEYNHRVTALLPQLDALKEPLDEALRSAPTYAAEEARAEAFGARSLNDFKKEHRFTAAGQDPDNLFYPLDLANQEGLYGSHPIDKHVGLTDDQLKMRLRDQGSVPAASTFQDLASAQKFTTATIEDINNADRVDKWIASVEKKIKNNPNYNPNASEIQPPLYKEFPGQSTGRSVSRDAYNADGMQAAAVSRSWVQVRLIYKQGLHPPFIVLTAMPHGSGP